MIAVKEGDVDEVNEWVWESTDERVPDDWIEELGVVENCGGVGSVDEVRLDFVVLELWVSNSYTALDWSDEYELL